MDRLCYFLILSSIIVVAASDFTSRNLQTSDRGKKNIQHNLIKLENQQITNQRRLFATNQLQSQMYALSLPFLQYISPIVYLMGLKVAGIQALFIWQLVELIQSQTNTLYIDIGGYINGYGSECFNEQAYDSSQLLTAINIVWACKLVLFVSGFTLKYLIAAIVKRKAINKCKRTVSSTEREIEFNTNPHIQTEQALLSKAKRQNSTNLHSEDSNITFHKKTIIESSFKGKTRVKRKDTLETQGETTAQSKLTKKSKLSNNSSLRLKNQNLSSMQPNEIQALHIQMDQSLKDYQRIINIGHFLITQIVFNLTINSIFLIGDKVSAQIAHNLYSGNSILSFESFIVLLSQIFMLLFSLKLLFQNSKRPANGQNRTKFDLESSTKFKIFWLAAIAERIVYTVLVKSGWKVSFILISILKLGMLAAFKFSKFWSNQTQFFRCLVFHFLHSLTLILVTFDQFYLSINGTTTISKNGIAWMLFLLLAAISVISIVFIVRDFASFARQKMSQNKLAKLNEKGSEQNEQSNFPQSKLTNKRAKSQKICKSNLGQQKVGLFTKQDMDRMLNGETSKIKTKTSMISRKDTLRIKQKQKQIDADMISIDDSLN